MDKDDRNYCELFIGNLNYETNNDDLKFYFSKYGEILQSKVRLNKRGEPAGFAFITFRFKSSVDDVMKNRAHFLHGRELFVKRQILYDNQYRNERNKSSTKLLVYSYENEDILKKYFEYYGQILNLEYKNEKEYLLTFNDYDIVDKIIIDKPHILHGIEIQVRKDMCEKKETTVINRRCRFSVVVSDTNLNSSTILTTSTTKSKINEPNVNDLEAEILYLKDQLKSMTTEFETKIEDMKINQHEKINKMNDLTILLKDEQ
ncbi:unnamed protein product, partial [Didymodactylos carnosus]